MNITSTRIYEKGDKLWNNIYANVNKFINDHEGSSDFYSGIGKMIAYVNWSDNQNLLTEK